RLRRCRGPRRVLMAIDQLKTVGELAAQSLAATRVFEDYGIDFCCGGSKPFETACREKHLDPRVVLGEIEAAVQQSDSADRRDWPNEPLEALIAYILDRHHTYLRAELPRIESWLAAVRKAHGERDGALLAELDSTFTAMKDELEAHMRKEEMVLFPAMRRSEGWIGQPIAVMEHEHDSAGRALTEMRRITGGYRVPEHACATYRALYSGLQELETDLHLHIHLENNILFPRAMAETSRSRGC
ncbi:MAG: iron-sulfur cluster repair di-iron protein, partial [Bryobacteraceae bacterium]